MKKTPKEWEAITGIIIIDPDGWRNDNKDYNEPISEHEWDHRMCASTCQFPFGYSQYTEKI